MAGNFVGTTKSAGDVLFASDHNVERKDIVLNAGDFVTTAGAANTYTATVDGQFVFQIGVVLKIKINTTNTGPSTLEVTPSGGSTTGAKNILKNGNPLGAGDAIAGQSYFIISDGTSWQIIGNLLDSVGDGSDGNFHATSDTILNPSYKVFQYGDFIVDPGKALTFGSNFQAMPIIVLVQGNLTLNAAIVNVNGMGATSAVSGSNPSNGNKSDYAFTDTSGKGGLQGVYTAGANGGAGTGGPASGVPAGAGFYSNLNVSRLVHIGSAGGSGGKGIKVGQVPTNTGGLGGYGGGGILFLVGGNIDVTNAVLTADGLNGVNGNQTDTTGSGSGAGGGGEGGSFGIGYRGTKTGSPATLTANKGLKGTCSHIAVSSVNGGGGGGGSGGGSGVAGSNGEALPTGMGGGNGSDGVDGYTQITKLIPYLS